MNVQCSFFALGPTLVQYLGEKEFNTFAEARKFLRTIIDTNIDVLESVYGYAAMICAIYN